MPNIERRGNRWYATLHVPPDVREALGKSKFLQSLKTPDKKIAEQRVRPLIAVWKEQIAAARGQAPDTFITEAMLWRNEYQTNDDQLAVREEILRVPKQHRTDGPTFYSIATGLLPTSREPLRVSDLFSGTEPPIRDDSSSAGL